MKDLWKEKKVIDRERRDLITELLKPHSEYFREKYLAIMVDCANSEKGHNFRFNHLGPLGHPWFYCTICGASKVGGLDDEP